jgi:hypothetical protein
VQARYGQISELPAENGALALRVLPLKLKEKSRDGLTALFCSEFSLAQRYAKVREGKDFSTWSIDWPW